MAKIVICLQPNHPKANFGDWEETFESNVELTGSGYENKIILDLPKLTADQAKEIHKIIEIGFEYDPNYLPKNRINLKRLTSNKNLRDNLQSLTYNQIISFLPTVSDPCEFI